MSTTPELTHENQPDPGFGTLAASIWFSPAEVGEAIARRVPWKAVLLAALVIVTVMVGAGWLCRDQLVADTLDMMRAKPGMNAEALEKMEGFFGSSAGKALLAGQNVIGSLVGFGLIALCLYLGQMLMGGRASFGQAFSVTVFSCLISFAASWILRVALVQAKGSFMAVSTGLGALVDAPMHDPLRSVLDLVDPFNIWAVVAAGIALAAPSRLSRNTTIAVSVGVYLLLGGLGVVMRIVGGR